MEYDLTWKNPTPAQEAALAMAMTRKPKHLTEFEAAEMICSADKSLWYIQAKKWAADPPPIGDASEFWKQACQFVVDVVDLGYDEEANVIWPLSKLGNEKELGVKMLLLMDFGMMLEQYRRQSMDIVSRGFDAFIEIVCGHGWQKRYKSFLKKAEKQIRETG